MFIELLRTLGILPQPLTLQQREDLEKRDAERIDWMDIVIHRLRPHTEKAIYFTFYQDESCVRCIVDELNAEQSSWEIQIHTDFPEEQWEDFWQLLNFRLRHDEMVDMRIRIISTPDHPSSDIEPDIAEHLVECRIEKRFWIFRGREQSVGSFSPNFT